MENNDLINLMFNKDYKERFKGEYYQLNDRITKLSLMVTKYKNNLLDFTPSCSLEILSTQLDHMRLYRDDLITRAKIEGIDLK